MNRSEKSTWRVVEGFHATHYMLIMVLSMAITVIFTRVYLEVTGYPQIGNDTFHIAHALWGGLLQVIATTLVLIYLNRWIFVLSAVLAGMGIGLFVDEIGKFITQTNDYFFPLAAPLIYVFVILFVLLYLYIRQEDDHDARGQMYNALDSLKPLLDNHMDRQQFDHLQSTLKTLSNQTERSDIADIAQALLQALPEDSSALPVSNRGFIDRIVGQLKQIEAKYFTQTWVHRLLVIFFFIMGATSLILVTLLAVILANPDYLEILIFSGIMHGTSLVNDPISLNWYLAWIVVTIAGGILYLIAFVAFVRQHIPFAIRIGTLGLVISLTIGNTMSFYFNQFSVMLTSVVLFGFLMILLRYRYRFVDTV